MAKLGVGVGDDFPIDDPKQPNPETQGAERAREEWRKARAEWRKRREEWRAQQRQCRDAWRRQRDEFRARLRGSRQESDHDLGFTDLTFIVALLALAALVLIATSAVLGHLYLFVGAIILGVLYLAWRGDFHEFGAEGAKPPPPAEPTKQEN